jgi:hypothetical protein
MRDSGLALHGPGGERWEMQCCGGCCRCSPSFLATSTSITHADLRPIGVRIGEPLAGVAAWATIADWLLLWRDLAEWKRIIKDGKLGRATRKPLRPSSALRVDQ